MTPAETSRASLAATHAHYSHDWWTPPEWLDWVSRTLGSDDWYDPCPRDWRSEDGSGLECTWANPCYVNHPGSRRGAATAWWRRYLEQRVHLSHFVWALFSLEQLRHMRPSALELPGWLVLPRTRIHWIWGGPDIGATATRAARRRGEPMRQPGHWSGFWATVLPADPPVESIIVRTGVSAHLAQPVAAPDSGSSCSCDGCPRGPSAEPHECPVERERGNDLWLCRCCDTCLRTCEAEAAQP